MVQQLLKKLTRKTGLPPGTLVHTGETIAAKPRVQVTCYDERDVISETLEAYGEISRGTPDKVTWIAVDGVHDPEMISEIGLRLGIHPLVLEDIVHTGQRPKLEEYDDYVYFTLRVLLPAASEDPPAEESSIRESQLSIVLCRQTVITFNEFGTQPFEPVLQRVLHGKGKITSKKEDYLVYALFDAVVDNYFLVLEDFGEQIEALEDVIFSRPDSFTLEKLHNLKRELAAMRRDVWPLREIINQLVRDEIPFIEASSYKYFRDVYDHTIQIIETLESMRDIVSGLFDIYLSSISHRMNQVMKVLTVIATIFIPLTFIAGVYGMNFQYMPELTWKWGYFTILAVMATLGFGMALYFKLKEWF